MIIRSLTCALAEKRLLMLPVIFFHLRRRNEQVGLHVLRPHRLDDDLFPLQVANFDMVILLRLHRLDKSVAGRRRNSP